MYHTEEPRSQNRSSDDPWSSRCQMNCIVLWMADPGPNSKRQVEKSLTLAYHRTKIGTTTSESSLIISSGLSRSPQVPCFPLQLLHHPQGCERTAGERQQKHPYAFIEKEWAIAHRIPGSAVTSVDTTQEFETGGRQPFPRYID